MDPLDDEGIKSIHILFSSFVVVIIYFCWKSTQINEQLPTVHHLPINLVRRSSSVVSNVSTATGSTTEENLTSSVENITDSIFVEASESYNQSNARDEPDSSRVADNELSEEEQIIRQMDQDLPVSSGSVRRRITQTSSEAESSTPVEGESSVQKEEDKISIKLKYLNDEIKTVNAYLNESLGSFKRRQFNAELESKLIKLIFNGQILGDDKKSLSQCGLFSEAVVHCLILSKRNAINPTASQLSSAPRNPNTNAGLLNSTPLEWNGTLFIYVLGMALVSLTLVFCWYCRIQYSSYFSWYSTIGLILMTSLFLVMVPLLTLIDR